MNLYIKYFSSYMFHVKPGMQFGMLNWTYATEVRDNRPCLIVKQKSHYKKEKKIHICTDYLLYENVNLQKALV